MCKCNTNTNETITNETIDAVRRKIERMAESALDQLEAKVTAIQGDVTAQVADINKKLFDGMTKKELVDGIVNQFDVLSIEGLLERKDVQDAIKQTVELRNKNAEEAFEIGGKIQKADYAINELAQSILDDVLIFGVTASVRNAILNFPKNVEAILKTVD